MPKINQKNEIQDVYKMLCSFLDKYQWHYEKEEENGIVRYGVNGEDLPMTFIIEVDKEKELLRLVSPFPFIIEENKRVEGAIITSYANYKIANGCFQYNYSQGNILFTMTSCFQGSFISEPFLYYFIIYSLNVVEHYNDKFMMVSKGLLSVEDFVKNE